MAKNKKSVPQDDIELANGNQNSSRTATNSGETQPSAWNTLNMYHGVTQYCTKENAILLGGGIVAAGAVAGIITVLVLYAFPDCKEYTFESGTYDEIKFPGKPVLGEYGTITLYAPATKEENYKKEFTINPGSWLPTECNLYVKKEGMTKKCDHSGYTLEEPLFSCTYKLTKDSDRDDDNTAYQQQDSYVGSVARSIYSLFGSGSNAATAQKPSNELVTKYDASTLSW